MRVGIVCHSSCGGSSRIAIELALHLARRQHIVHLFSSKPPFGLVEDQSGLVSHYFPPEYQRNLPVTELHTDWSLSEQEQFLANLIKVVYQEGLDVIHFHYAVPFAFLLAELKQRLGSVCPFLVGTLHGTDVSVFGHDPMMAARLERALAQMDMITTVSNNHAHLASKLLGMTLSPGYFRVVPNFVDRSEYYRYNGSHQPPGPIPRIIHISNYRPVKAPRELGEIFARVCAKQDAELWLVGEGPGLDELKSFLIQAGLNHKVRYLGLQPKVGPILAQADLLLMTSLAESFCLTVLEAMACGIPAIATRVGGIPELVQFGQTGFLYQPGQPDEAAHYILHLFSNPTLYTSFASSALQEALKYSSEWIINLYEEIYNLSFMRKTRQ
jgi:N-acetyl-alpha-D-glucosaminyl L-malate synthase BshA